MVCNCFLIHLANYYKRIDYQCVKNIAQNIDIIKCYKMLTDLMIPYMMQSEINIKMVNSITYYQLLSMYDEELRAKIQTLNSSLLNETIFLFELQMMPENLHWKLWKNKDQIIMFLMKIDHEITEMKESGDRMVDNGQQILHLHEQLKGNFNFNQQMLGTFVQYLNLLSQNIYTRKAQQFLIFIQHCISVDKWGMKIYQQVIVDKAPSFTNKITGFFKSDNNQTRERDYIITITSDGILKSDNHLLQSRVKSMIPFTSQLNISMTVDKEGFMSIQISACAHEQMVINLYKDYIKAINLTVALKMALKQSSYNMPHRFSSFSPRRNNCASKLYNDGAEYYEDIYHLLMSAKRQVCITGWMISPYFLMKRPNSIESKEFRLDGILEQLAHRGVKIFIICFMQPAMFVNNDSEYVQVYLQSLHDNIKVYRHPNDTIPLLWSHHQKMVIIDQQVGFMGGLDICYGRWDTPQHRLVDPGLLWDGLDYNNYRTKDIYEPRKYQESNLNKDFQPRMPWHDIAIQYRGDVVLDLLRHFVQYWYFVKSELLTDPMRVWNFMKKRYDQAFNETHSKAQKEEMKYYMKQIKKREEAVSFTKKLSYMVNGRQEKLPQLLIEARPGKTVGSETLQMCRSASEWSIGVRPQKHQCSIHHAYQQLIKESKNFIYIENQFFMGLQNKIVECLVERISRAHTKGEKFRVVVVLPLLPGFEGDIADPAATVLRIQVHHQYNAISRGGKSLYEQLSYIPNVKEYISFFGLRQSEIVNGTPMTEIIYVHSKLMIVDDERCIIGSANINDRSLLGTRDSQLACVIEENQGNILDLRCRIFNEHFGLSSQESKNILEPAIWQKIATNARNGTLFYREVFGCIPDDNVTVAAEVSKLADTAKLMNYNQGRGNLIGHAVEYPLNFMKDEDLTFKLGQKQYLAPEMSFT